MLPISCQSTVIFPECGLIYQAINLMSVDFHDPDAPTSAILRHACSSSEKFTNKGFESEYQKFMLDRIIEVFDGVNIIPC